MKKTIAMMVLLALACNVPVKAQVAAQAAAQAAGTYTDCTAFNLNGKVKKVACSEGTGSISEGPTDEGYSELTFTRAGKADLLDEMKLPMAGDDVGAASFFKRDKAGRLAEFCMSGANGYESKTVFTYGANGRIASSQVYFDGKKDGAPVSFKYDGNGNLVKRGGIVYTILKTDAQGNWLSRKYKNDWDEVVTENRAITYYNTSQNVLDFEVSAPNTLITAKGNYANIRERPSLKAPYVKMLGLDDWNATLQDHAVMNATDAGNGWWKTSKGYISKSVTKVVPAAAVPEDRIGKFAAGYHGDDMDDRGSWRVSRNKATGLVLCEYDDNPIYGLYLGKEVNGVFCFKYFVTLFLTYDENAAKLKVAKEEDTDGATGRKSYSYTITYGPSYVKRLKNPKYNPHGSDMESANEYFVYLDFSRLPKDMIEYIFKDEIENDNVNEYYVNAYMMSDKFEYPYSAW